MPPMSYPSTNSVMALPSGSDDDELARRQVLADDQSVDRDALGLDPRDAMLDRAMHAACAASMVILAEHPRQRATGELGKVGQLAHGVELAVEQVLAEHGVAAEHVEQRVLAAVQLVLGGPSPSIDL